VSRLQQTGSEQEAVWGSRGLQSSGLLPAPGGGGPCQKDPVKLATGQKLSLDDFGMRTGLQANTWSGREKNRHNGERSN
jgi:hypothetical protein